MKRELKILISASLACNFAFGLLGPIYAIFVENIGGDILTAGYTWAIYSISLGVATFIFSRFEDKLPKEKMIVLGYGLLSFGHLGYYFVQNATHLFMVQIYMGLSLALIDPIWSAYFTIKTDRRREAAEWGDWGAGTNIAIGIAAVVGSYIAHQFGFKSLFLIMFVIGLISTGISYLLLKKRKRRKV